MSLLDIGHGLLEYRQRFKPEEVHLDKSGFLNDATFVLGHQQFALLLVVGRGYGHPIGDVIAANDDAAGMYARIADITLEGTGVVKRLAHKRI